MSVASKNLYELLGNDDDSDTPKAPVKTVDKTSTHTVKRNTDGTAPASAAPAAAVGGGRRGGFTGNEAAFRDRQAGSDRNRGKPTEDGATGARGARGTRARGGRGGRPPRDDRHTKGLASGSEKQAAQSWGATEGNAELKDEQAGEAIAQSEQKEAAAEGDAEENAAEAEDKSISYDAYLAQLAEKKLALEALEIRKPNEGTKEDKKWANAKPLVKDDDDAFMVGSGAKAKRERERKTKQVLEIENRYIEPERTRGGVRGGRGGGRGGESRGGGRGGGESRGDRRGGGRGGSRGDFRGDFRGGRGGRESAAAPINTSDTSAFPSLGGK